MKRLPKGLELSQNGTMSVARLYQTDIVTRVENRLTLRNGGWATKHTKKCLNLVLGQVGIEIKQKAFVWYVIQNGTKIPFQDGMQIEIQSQNKAA